MKYKAKCKAETQAKLGFNVDPNAVLISFVGRWATEKGIDLIIEGLLGIRAVLGALLVVRPLADATVSYFALDNLAYHGHNISVLYDPNGARWGAKSGCKGLCVFVDGKVAARADGLERLSVDLSALDPLVEA